MFCGYFGTYLYLLSCSRICYVCLMENTQFLPLAPANARITFGLNRRELSKLPIALSLPGRYSGFDKIRRTRSALVDRESARQAGIAVHHSSAQMEAYVGFPQSFLSLTSNVCVRARYASQLKAERAAKYEARLLRHVVGSRKPPAPPYIPIFLVERVLIHFATCVWLAFHGSIGAVVRSNGAFRAMAAETCFTTTQTGYLTGEHCILRTDIYSISRFVSSLSMH